MQVMFRSRAIFEMVVIPLSRMTRCRSTLIVSADLIFLRMAAPCFGLHIAPLHGTIIASAGQNPHVQSTAYSAPAFNYDGVKRSASWIHEWPSHFSRRRRYHHAKQHEKTLLALILTSITINAILSAARRVQGAGERSGV